MSREIKFRSWDGERMWAWNELQSEGHSFFDIADNDLSPHSVMQFTGLKDKNGVEIYEGDIVMYANDYLSGSLPPEPPEPHNDFAVVQYSDLHAAFIGNAFYKNNHEKHSMPLHQLLDEYGKVEVIENIYESPDFLGTKAEAA